MVMLVTGHFGPILYSRQFRLRTDRVYPKWLHRRAEPSYQVRRWIKNLAEFAYGIEHDVGSLHENARQLSSRCGKCKQCNTIGMMDGGPNNVLGKDEISNSWEQNLHTATQFNTTTGK